MKIRMYTQSNAYLNKTSSSLLLALLLLSALLAFLPISVVHGSTGTVDLGTVNNLTSSATYTAATSFVSVTAGSAMAQNDCNVRPCNAGYLAINFNTVDFSGSQFKLYLSTNGFSQINTTTGETSDVPLTTNVFNVGALSGTFGEIGTTGYYIGTVGGDMIVAGPIPVDISNAYRFIKVYDGSSSSVAASIKEINILPGLSLTPNVGPAGTTVTIMGGGFPAHTVINLNYSFPFYSYANPSVLTKMKGNWTTGINTGLGYFTTSAAIVDVKQVINPPPLEPIPTVVISITATHYAGLSTVTYANTTFTENIRFVSQVLSLDSSGSKLYTENPFVSGRAYGSYNGSETLSCEDDLVVCVLYTQDAVSIGSLIIAGNNSQVNSLVTFLVGSTATGGTLTPMGSTSSNGIGDFNGTASIPALSIGLHLVIVQNNGVQYWFQIYILPSLVLTPTSGPVHTLITAKGYGFPAGANIYLYWYEIYTYDYTYFNLNTTEGALINITVPSDGFFSGIQFYAPHSFGGYHDVSAATLYVNNPDYVPGSDVADSSFLITPHITISPSTVNANQKGFLNVTGTGFNPYAAYYMSIDNAVFGAAYPGFVAAYNGDLLINFTSTGYQPGWHQVEMFPSCDWAGYYSCYSYYGSFAPVAFTYFNVTTIGAYVSNR